MFFMIFNLLILSSLIPSSFAFTCQLEGNFCDGKDKNLIHSCLWDDSGWILKHKFCKKGWQCIGSETQASSFCLKTFDKRTIDPLCSSHQSSMSSFCVPITHNEAVIIQCTKNLMYNISSTSTFPTFPASATDGYLITKCPNDHVCVTEQIKNPNLQTRAACKRGNGTPFIPRSPPTPNQLCNTDISTTRCLDDQKIVTCSSKGKGKVTSSCASDEWCLVEEEGAYCLNWNTDFGEEFQYRCGNLPTFTQLCLSQGNSGTPGVLECFETSGEIRRVKKCLQIGLRAKITE
jgi:hypothetical protein